MEIEKMQSIIESMLFAAGRAVSVDEIQIALELPKGDIEKIII